MRPGMKPQRKQAAGARPTDKMLYLLVGGVAVALIVFMVASGMGSRESEPVGEIPVSWTARPTWARDTEPGRLHERAKQKEPQALAVYLDVSEPMGGFLPPSSQPSAASAFRSVVLNVVPEQLARVSGSSGSPLEWSFVATNPEAVERPRTLTRGVFNGGESRLNEAATEILRGFDEGRLEAAVLITDLVATDELTGAMGVALPLSDRMSSGSVRKGEFHLGLLGIQAPYWGAESKYCAPVARDLGCWFSEQAQRYKPLTQRATVPFYVLIMGRNFETVQEIGEGIRTGAAKLEGLKPQWEVLTEVVRERQLGEVMCTAHRAGGRQEPQFALVQQEDRSVRCQREDEVEILCPLPDGARFEPRKATTSWPGVGAAFEGKDIVLNVDCGALRASIPSGGLTVKVEGPPTLNGDTSQWQSWSSESDEREEDLGRTLQLISFLDKVRPKPERLELTSTTLLERFDR